MGGSKVEPIEYQRKVSDAISALEANGPGAGAAMDFLMALRSDPYRLAVKSFLPALKSESSDVRSIAACALGRFGRGNQEVFEALTAAYTCEEDRFSTASRILHAIASLQTPAAARFLVNELKNVLDINPDSVEVNSVGSAIRVLGVAIVQEMKNIHEVLFTTHKLDHYLHRKLYHEICKDMARLYERFRRDGYNHLKGGFLEYRDLHATTGEQFGEVSVITDQRVEFLTLPRYSASVDLNHVPEEYRQEVRIVILEKPHKDYLVVAVADWMTKPSLSSKIEEFGRAAIQSMVQSGLKTDRVQFGIFRPTDMDRPFTGFTLVIKDKLPTIGHFSYDKSLDDWCGESAKEVRSLLSRAPVPTLDLQEYAQATIQDERIQQLYKQQLSTSPDSRIDYSELASDFTHAVQSMRERKLPVSRQKRSVFADSFDAAENAEFFGATVPVEVKEHLVRCEHIFEVSKDSKVHPDSIAWPSPLELPFELFRSEIRSYEFGAPTSDFEKSLDLDPRIHGVVLLVGRGEDGEMWRMTNIPRTVFNRSSGFSWGYSGSGPYELALNILNYFVAPGSDGLPEHALQSPYWGSRKRTFASDTALKLSRQFREEFIENLPLYGGIISADRIRQWILDSLKT